MPVDDRLTPETKTAPANRSCFVELHLGTHVQGHCTIAGTVFESFVRSLVRSLSTATACSVIVSPFRKVNAKPGGIFIDVPESVPVREVIRSVQFAVFVARSACGKISISFVFNYL